MGRLTTLARVKTELRLTTGEDDAYLDLLIDEASSALVAWAGRPFARARAVETRDGSDQPLLLLNRTPIVEIVEVAHAPLDGPAAVLPATGYRVADTEVGVLARIGGTWQRAGSVPIWRIDYVAGWRLPGEADRDLPPLIERACIETVKAAWFARGRDPNLVSEQADEIYSARWAGEGAEFLPPIARALVPRRPV